MKFLKWTAVLATGTMLGIGVLTPANAQQGNGAPSIKELPKDLQPGGIPQRVVKFLSEPVDLNLLDDNQLRGRAREAQRFLDRFENMPVETRDQLVGVVSAVQAELRLRREAKPVAPEIQPQPQPQPVVVQPAPAPPQPEPIIEVRPKQRKPVVQPEATQPAPVIVVEPSQPPKAPREFRDDTGQSDPALEARALAILNAPSPARRMRDDELRRRLDDIRSLMIGNQLSRRTEKRLRDLLRQEREILRENIAEREAAEEQKQFEAAPRRRKESNVNLDVVINLDTPRKVILQDRRDSEDLQEIELRRRIEVSRDADRDQSFNTQDREFYRESVRRDRAELRRKMLAERQRRRAELIQDVEDDEISLNDRQIVVPSRRKRDVFAAEAEEDDLEDVLIAPPARKLRRRLSIDEASYDPEARSAMPRIEVDTIRFGFGESFVREEEVDSLDRVANVIEKILAKYPREVFLIEGHTDAVGGDEANVRLSKARAEAVKKALTEYFVIPARNLKTVGLGERFLKIPTDEAEGENRRVSIVRATPLIGEVE